VIGDGSKLDNMVHIAHNCHIGRHVVIAAQTGLAGGVTIGDYAVVGGQVGVGDKARIEAKAIIGSGAGILTSKIVRAGEPVWGTPAGRSGSIWSSWQHLPAYRSGALSKRMVVVIGGHTRNIGKTSVVCAVIRALPDWNWTAIKIKRYGHGICSRHRGLCDCPDPKHPVTVSEENGASPSSDSGRFPAAGAARAFWIRTLAEE